MNRNVLLYLVCPECGTGNLVLEVYAALDNEQVDEGCLICPECLRWFRIENGIVDLLPMQLRKTNHERFMWRSERFAQKHGLALPREADNPQGKATAGKTKPIGAFEDVVDYEQRVVNNPYYKALDQVAFHEWMERTLGPEDLVLDIGCGSGRQCLPLAERNIQVIGLDIDEDMLEVAAKKINEKSLGRLVDLIIADGANPPVRENAFTACVLYGVLHHLSSKQQAIANASAKLVLGGRIYSLDPHRSPARFAFDFMMRIWKLYVEEASDDPLITEHQLYEWMQSANIEGKVRFSTYLPPHIFIAGFSTNVSILRITDRFFGNLARIRQIGGVVIFEGQKAAKPA